MTKILGDNAVLEDNIIREKETIFRLKVLNTISNYLAIKWGITLDGTEDLLTIFKLINDLRIPLRDRLIEAGSPEEIDTNDLLNYGVLAALNSLLQMTDQFQSHNDARTILFHPAASIGGSLALLNWSALAMTAEQKSYTMKTAHDIVVKIISLTFGEGFAERITAEFIDKIRDQIPEVDYNLPPSEEIQNLIG